MSPLGLRILSAKRARAQASAAGRSVRFWTLTLYINSLVAAGTALKGTDN